MTSSECRECGALITVDEVLCEECAPAEGES